MPMSDESATDTTGAAQSAAAGVIDIRKVLDEGEWGGYQKFVVMLLALTIIFDGADIQLLSVAVPTLMQEWSLERTAFAPILAVGLLGMALGGAFAGVVGDRIGRRTALIGSVVTFGLMTAAMSFADGLMTLGVFRFLAGLGLGGAMPNATALASEFVPRRSRPLAITLTIVCVPLGGTLTGLLAIRILPDLGWKGLFIVGGLLPLGMALVLLALLPESPRFLARHPEAWQRLTSLLRRMGRQTAHGDTYTDSEERVGKRPTIGELFVPDFQRDTLALWLSFLGCLLAVYLCFNWVPAMITGAGLNPTVAGTGITAFNLGGVVGALLGAFVITRIGSKPTMLTMSAGTIVGALVLRSLDIGPAIDTTILIGMLAITGALLNGVQTTLYALAANVYPTSFRATGVGSAVSVGRAGGILSTFLGAWALDLGGPPAFFTTLAVAMVFVLIGLATVRRHIQPSTRLTG